MVNVFRTDSISNNAGPVVRIAASADNEKLMDHSVRTI